MNRARFIASATPRWFDAVSCVRRRGIILPDGATNFFRISTSL